MLGCLFYLFLIISNLYFYFLQTLVALAFLVCLGIGSLFLLNRVGHWFIPQMKTSLDAMKELAQSLGGSFHYGMWERYAKIPYDNGHLIIEIHVLKRDVGTHLCFQNVTFGHGSVRLYDVKPEKPLDNLNAEQVNAVRALVAISPQANLQYLRVENTYAKVFISGSFGKDKETMKTGTLQAVAAFETACEKIGGKHPGTA